MYLQIPTRQDEAMQNLTVEKVFALFNSGQIHAYILAPEKPREIEGFTIFFIKNFEPKKWWAQRAAWSQRAGPNDRNLKGT